MTRTKTNALLAAAVIVIAGCAVAFAAADLNHQSAERQDRDELYQVSLLAGLMSGDYYGHVTVAELKARGDTGLGTYDGLNGELIMLNGTVYQAKGDGTVSVADDNQTVPYASVAFLDADRTESLGALDLAGLKDALNALVAAEGANQVYVVTVTGTFASVHVRSELAQTEPYKPLTEVLATDQREFTYSDLSGTVVGLYCPDYLSNFDAVGWHFHFISSDGTQGGHLLDVSMTAGTVTMDRQAGIEQYLPNTDYFNSLDLVADAKDVDGIEH